MGTRSCKVSSRVEKVAQGVDIIIATPEINNIA